MLSLSDEASHSTVALNPSTRLVTMSDIVDTRFSDLARSPVKALPTMSEGTTLRSGNFPAPLLSETAIETTSDMDFAAPLATTSEIAEARLSDVVLNPVKALDAASDTVGASASVLNPVKTLPTTSEATTLSNANFPAPLLILSLNAQATLSAVLRNAVKVLVTLSDTADTEFSEIARAPMKTLPTTSEGTRLSSGNFAAALPIESPIETTTVR